MPFLRAALISKERRDMSVRSDLPLEPEVISGVTPVEPYYDGQIDIDFHEAQNSEDESYDFESMTKTERGRKYEKYVGLLYEKGKYEVEYNGIKRGSHDRGIDLICRKDSYTVLVQCKYYDVKEVSLRDIYYFYGSSRHYAIQHPKEIVRSSFWTNKVIKRTSEVFRAIVELGILLYENAKGSSKGQQK